MEKFNVWCVCLLMANMFECILNRGISFIQPMQGDFITECESGVLINDLVVIKSIANFTGINVNTSPVFASHEIFEMTSQDTHQLFDHDLNVPCGNAADDTYNCTTIETNIVRFTFKIKALPNYIGSKLIGNLVNTSTTINRSTQDFPAVIETTNVTGKLTVNGRIYPAEDININITVKVLSVQFECSSLSKPCQIEMMINAIKSIKRSDYVEFEKIVINNGNVYSINIKYAACRLDHEYNEFNLVITADSAFSSLDLTPWIIGAYIYALMVILVHVFFYYFYCNQRVLIQNCDAQDSLPLDLTDSNEENKNKFKGMKEIKRYKGQSFLHMFYINCKKNASHDQFTPLQEFTIDYLPQQLHDQKIVEFIKATATRTVRLSVNLNSTARPNIWNNNHEPLSSDARSLPRIGTGFVSDFHMYQFEEGDYNIGRCPCQKCKDSESPSEKWWIVKVTTAKYVVFDDSEAEETTCRFHFDDKNNSSLSTLKGWEIESSSLEEDRCILRIKTCDQSILDSFGDALINWYRDKNDIDRKYSSNYPDPIFTFIVSHPHGCPKYVSLGECINKTELPGDKMHTSYTYTTSTCAACTGAYVHFLGVNVDITRGSHIHLGTNKSGNNYCSIGHEMNSSNDDTTNANK